MAMELLPEWMAGLEEEDVAFIKKFILASGSLKEVAGQYGEIGRASCRERV